MESAGVALGEGTGRPCAAARSRIQKAIDIHADELDYLGFYLETGFNIWNIESKKIRLSISGASAAVDRYYSSRDAGVALPKPTLKLRPYFSSVIQRISERKQPHWLSYATLLLRSMSYEEQRQLENALTTLRAGVTRHWRDPSHECSIVVTPSPIRDAALLFYVFPPQHLNCRDETLEILSAQALENSGRSRCVILARNTSMWDEPYTYLAMAIEPGGAPFFIPNIEDNQGVIN
jgi:hypothetical protein